MANATKGQIKKVLERIRAEMIAYYRGSYTKNAKIIDKVYGDKIDKIDKQLMKIPIYKTIFKKRMDADRGMYFAKVNYTQDEENFLKTNKLYLKMERLYDEQFKKEKIEQKAFYRRIRKETLTPDEERVVKNAECGVREDKNKGLVVLTLDSDFYDLGWRKEYFEARLDYLLAKLGCMIEPWDGSRWEVAIWESKPKSLQGFKEKYLKDHPYAAKHIKNLR